MVTWDAPRRAPIFCAGNEFYTDANSHEMVKRVRGLRSGYAPVLPEELTANPLGGNYFPITSAIAIADKSTKQQLLLVTERGQGIDLITDYRQLRPSGQLGIATR